MFWVFVLFLWSFLFGFFVGRGEVGVLFVCLWVCVRFFLWLVGFLFYQPTFNNWLLQSLDLFPVPVCSGLDQVGWPAQHCIHLETSFITTDGLESQQSLSLEKLC